MNKQQVENVRMAYAIMAGMPAKRIDLDRIRSGRPADDWFLTRECGSVACIAGVISAHPHFKEQGLAYDPWSGNVTLCGYHGLGNAASRLMGDAVAFDGSMFDMPPKLEALERLREILFDNGHLSAARNTQLARKELRDYDEEISKEIEARRAESKGAKP